MISMIYIGIDPGSKGYISVLNENGECLSELPIEDSTDQEISHFLQYWKGHSERCVAVMEKVHSMPGQGVSTTFAFGKNVGFVLGLMVAHEIPYTLVPPQKWQKCIWITDDYVYTVRKDSKGEEKRQISPKPTSINAATRLFPSVDLRKSSRSKNPHDGKCDSLLIALYAKRNNL